jgi:hypothetical protein
LRPGFERASAGFVREDATLKVSGSLPPRHFTFRFVLPLAIVPSDIPCAAPGFTRFSLYSCDINEELNARVAAA